MGNLVWVVDDDESDDHDHNHFSGERKFNIKVVIHPNVI